MIIQWIGLALLVVLSGMTGGVIWCLRFLIKQGRETAAAHMNGHEDLITRLNALERRQSEIARDIALSVVELQKARGEAADRHGGTLKEIAVAVSTVKDAEDRLQSAIDGLAASQREHTERDVMTLMAALSDVAVDVRSLKPSVPLPADRLPQEWVLNSQDHPAVRVRLVDESVLALAPSGEGLKMLPERVSGFLTNICQSLFGSAAPQFLPGIVSGVQGLIRTRVVFSPEVLAGLANGTYRHVLSGDGRWLALAQDVRTGLFVEIGQMVTSLNPVAVISLAWQIATFVTAQHHLANIRRELFGLQRQLSHIQLWLSSKEMGSLQGDFAYLDQIDHFLAAGAVSYPELPLYLGKVEDMERGSIGSYQAAKIRIQTVQDELRPLIEKGLKLKDKEAFQDNLKRYEDDCNIITASLFVRVRAVNTRRLLSLNHAVTQYRMLHTDTVRQELSELTTDFCKAMGDVSPEPSWFQISKRKQKFQDENDDARTRVQASIEEQLQSLEQFQVRLSTTGFERLVEEDMTFECDYDPQTQSVRAARQTGAPTYVEDIGDVSDEDTPSTATEDLSERSDFSTR